MKKRKPNNLAQRQLRFTRSLFRSHCVSVVRVGDNQLVMHWGNQKAIKVGELVQNGINGLPHHWTIYLAAICRSQTGERYFKPREIAPTGAYKADQLTAVLNEHMEDLVQTECNPAHVLRTAWIALPYDKSLTEKEADRIFEKMRAWDIEQTDMRETM